MATLDAELRQVALDLIDELGKTVQFRTVLASYEPTTGLTTESSEVFVDVKATPPAPKRLFLQDDDILVHGDLYFYIAAQGLTFTPYNGQIIKIESETMRIVSVDPIYSGEQVCIYGLRVTQ